MSSWITSSLLVVAVVAAVAVVAVVADVADVASVAGVAGTAAKKNMYSLFVAVQKKTLYHYLIAASSCQTTESIHFFLQSKKTTAIDQKSSG